MALRRGDVLIVIKPAGERSGPDVDSRHTRPSLQQGANMATHNQGRQTMRVMVFVKSSEDGNSGMEPTPEALEAFRAMDAFTEELVQAGVFVAAAGLKNGAESRRVVFEGEQRRIIDGPFAEARELIAGFSIWEVRDMDEAMAWAQRCPNPTPGRSEIEIRPFFEAEDLAGFVTPEEMAAPRDGERGTLGVA